MWFLKWLVLTEGQSGNATGNGACSLPLSALNGLSVGGSPCHCLCWTSWGKIWGIRDLLGFDRLQNNWLCLPECCIRKRCAKNNFSHLLYRLVAQAVIIWSSAGLGWAVCGQSLWRRQAWANQTGEISAVRTSWATWCLSTKPMSCQLQNKMKLSFKTMKKRQTVM